jgi:hypothetical protein
MNEGRSRVDRAAKADHVRGRLSDEHSECEQEQSAQRAEHSSLDRKRTISTCTFDREHAQRSASTGLLVEAAGQVRFGRAREWWVCTDRHFAIVRSAGK